MNKLTIMIFFLFSYSFCMGNSFSFFEAALQDDGSVNISLNQELKGFSYAELFRSEGDGNFVPIYEFSNQSGVYSERFVPGVCYRTKIYFDNGSSVVSDPQCVSKMTSLGRFDIGFVISLVVFIISCMLSRFFDMTIFRNQNFGAGKIFGTVKSFLDEESRDAVFFLNDQDFFDPSKEPFKKIVSLFSFYCDADNKKLAASDISSMKTICQKERMSEASLYLSCHSGSIGSDNIHFMIPENKKIITLSTSVPSAVPSMICGGKTLISIESFTLPSDMECYKSSVRTNYGPYLFMFFTILVIFVGSVLYTIDSVFPLFTMIRTFLAGGK
jgi:hypothetical protein